MTLASRRIACLALAALCLLAVACGVKQESETHESGSNAGHDAPTSSTETAVPAATPTPAFTETGEPLYSYNIELLRNPLRTARHSVAFNSMRARLKETGGKSYGLVFAFSVECADARTRADVEENADALREEVIALMAEFTPTELRTAAGKLEMKDRVARRLRESEALEHRNVQAVHLLNPFLIQEIR